MESDLNFKAVLLSWFNNKKLKNKWFWHHRDWPSFDFWELVVSDRILVSVRENKWSWICLQYVFSWLSADDFFSYSTCFLWNAFMVFCQKVCGYFTLTVSVLFGVSCFEVLLWMGLIFSTMMVWCSSIWETEILQGRQWSNGQKKTSPSWTELLNSEYNFLLYNFIHSFLISDIQGVRTLMSSRAQ